MKTVESTPLYSARVESGETIQQLELALFVLINLLAVATTIVAVIFAFSKHPEHLVGAVATIISALSFAMLGRMYKNDIMQDRKIVYLTGITCMFVCISTIVYVAQWGTTCAAAAAGSNCPNAYFPVQSPDRCVQFTNLTTAYSPCYLGSAAGMANAYKFSPLPNIPWAINTTGRAFGVNEAYNIWYYCMRPAGVRCTSTAFCR